jgi:hypothetical protein
MRRTMKLLRWRSDTIAKSLLFCRVATIVFSSCCLVILITFFLWFQMASTQRRYKEVKIISTLLRQLAMILATNIFASDGQQWRALSLSLPEYKSTCMIVVYTKSCILVTFIYKYWYFSLAKWDFKSIKVYFISIKFITTLYMIKATQK